MRLSWFLQMWLLHKADKKILVMKASMKLHVYKIAACAQKQIMRTRTRTRGQKTTPTIKNGVLHTPDKRFVIVK